MPIILVNVRVFVSLDGPRFGELLPPAITGSSWQLMVIHAKTMESRSDMSRQHRLSLDEPMVILKLDVTNDVALISFLLILQS